ncbi:MAG: methyl-accepting chemotaxis protein [Lachnospiraceae bacterium]|nr:methyl-accepting chemotaxis protein [Lachnospiraceae bacterium]
MNEKTIEKKHLRETNSLTFVCLMLIHIFALVLVFMFAGKRQTSIWVCLLFVLLGMALTCIGRVKHVEDHKGHLIMFLGVAITFFDTLWTNLETPYLYGITFLICFVIMLHRSTRVCVLGCVVALFGNFVSTALYFLFTDRSMTTQVILNDVMAIMTCTIAFLVVKRMNAQSDEIIGAIEEKAKEQETSAGNVRQKSLEIKNLLSDANSYVESLASSIDISATSVSHISESSKKTAESIQTQTTMSANITESLEKIVNCTKEMLQTSRQAIDVVNTGNRTVENLKHQADIVSQINEETAEITRELQDRATGIKEVVNTILAISSQTNLLSLNANIEAARAGEAGRGFAVVADEIRGLSDSTKESAEQIAQVIDLLVENIVSASENMQRTVEAAKKEEELINVTEEQFQQINQSVESLSVAVTEIEQRVTDSASANEEVMDSITDLSASSEEVVASADSSLDVSRDCVDTMEETKNVLSRIFELSEKL